MEKKNAGKFGINSMEHKICNNCFAVMTWKMDEGRFICFSCGNADPSEEELKRKTNSYIN